MVPRTRPISSLSGQEPVFSSFHLSVAIWKMDILEGAPDLRDTHPTPQRKASLVKAKGVLAPYVGGTREPDVGFNSA